MTKLKLVSPVPPSVNHYLAYRAVIKNGKPVAMSYKTTEAKAYQYKFMEYVKTEVQKQGYNVQPNPLQHMYVDCTFYFPRIDQDANNYFKCMLDAITDTGLVWVDDNIVCERVKGIYYDTQNPRVELEIYPVDYIGIFNNQEQLSEFEDKCKQCKRYSRNCGILRQAKEGRIQDEICDMQCSSFSIKKGL